MGKIKAWYRSIPLWLAIFLFAAAALITASLASSRVTSAAKAKMSQLNLQYIMIQDRTPGDSGIVYETVTGERGETFFYKVDIDGMSPGDERLYRICRWVIQYAPVFLYSVSLLTAVLLLYFTKLKKPLAMLVNASEKIAEKDFAFSLNYPGRDEMAKLCGAFERMRCALDENNLRLSRMIEERKQLNDAYTHDLRTPIAVLKGYTDTLSEYLPTGELPRERVIETVHTMSAHVERLRQFVDSMNTAQKLSDLPIQRETVPTGDLITGLRETTTLLGEKQGISCTITSDIEAATLNIDPAAVTQVFENLLDNALRFARSKIAVELASDGETLTIRVADDGRGFQSKELTAAAKPYYSGEQNEKTYHFGLGLYICHTLCEKHGGSLRLENPEGGGAAVTAVFSLVQRFF